MIYNPKIVTIYILQIISVYNALVKGWNVKKINHNTYSFSRTIASIEDLKITPQSFIDEIISCNFVTPEIKSC